MPDKWTFKISPEGAMPNFNKVKKQIEQYRDFFGQDIIFVEPPKNLKDLSKALQAHFRFLEDQNRDALAHLDDFIKGLNLPY